MEKYANAALVCLLLGCGREAASHEAPRSPESSGWEQAQAQPVAPLPLAAHGLDCCASCPVALSDVKVEYGESGGGAVMLFTTPNQSDEVELRRRVAELAAYHNHQEHKLAMITQPHRADVQPLNGGARMDLVPSALNNPSEFRTEVQREVEWMQAGHCPPLGQQNECVACDLHRP